MLHLPNWGSCVILADGDGLEIRAVTSLRELQIRKVRYSALGIGSQAIDEQIHRSISASTILNTSFTRQARAFLA